jgi:hypothetical protein
MNSSVFEEMNMQRLMKFWLFVGYIYTLVHLPSRTYGFTLYWGNAVLPSRSNQSQRYEMNFIVKYSRERSISLRKRYQIDLMQKQSTSSSSEMSTDNSVNFTEAEEQLIEVLYEKLHALSDESIRESILLEALPTLRPSLLLKLREAENYEKSNPVRSVSQKLNNMLNARLELAKITLQELLSAGEIRKLDNLIGSAARSGRLDVAFFNVLTVNLQEAMAKAEDDNSSESKSDKENDGTAASRLQILKHVYTRCQEEVEKTIPPGTALLNKLLRTEHSSIRKNLYEHYLTPRPNTITTPDGKTVTLNGTQPVLVSINDFVQAVDMAVLQIRDVENAGGTDKESAAMMVEGCRHIAKEARIVVGNAYGRDSEELILFEEGLQPVFRPSNATSPYIKGTN